jgi:hypothetical protein
MAERRISCLFRGHGTENTNVDSAGLSGSLRSIANDEDLSAMNVSISVRSFCHSHAKSFQLRVPYEVVAACGERQAI